MNNLSLVKTGMLAAVGAMLCSGCVVRERVVYRPAPPTAYVAPATAEVVVSQAPPPPVEEVVTVAPASGFIWIGGAWVWHGRWQWERGHWDRPPRPGCVWRPHHYEYRNGVHVFIRGGWSF